MPRLFDELQATEVKPTFYTYCNLLDGLCTNGQSGQALLLLDDMENKGEHLSIQYYNIIIDGLCRAKELHKARVIFGNLPCKGLEPNVI